MKLEFFEISAKNTQISNLMKIRQVRAELFHTDRQTDVTKLIVTFHNFSKASKINRPTSYPTNHKFGSHLRIRNCKSIGVAAVLKLVTPAIWIVCAHSTVRFGIHYFGSQIFTCYFRFSFAKYAVGYLALASMCGSERSWCNAHRINKTATGWRQQPQVRNVEAEHFRRTCYTFMFPYTLSLLMRATPLP
jgi:hypothetical protein